MGQIRGVIVRARHRRRVHLAVALAAFLPGGVASLFWAHALAWVVFMSWVSFWYAPLSAWAAETPVEEEDQ